MPKQDPKSTEKYSTVEELALMRMSIKSMRDHFNDSLDAMLDQINRLIPIEDQLRYAKYKNYKKEDWRQFLGF